MIKKITSLILIIVLIYCPFVSADYDSELQRFPGSYRDKLEKLHNKHPEWVFVAIDTGLDFQTAVKNERGKKSLVEKYYSDMLKRHEKGFYDPDTGSYTYYDASTWVSAADAVVDYYMNPLNFLHEEAIFMFEALSYDENYHTQEGVELILKGTFMANTKISYVTAEGETIDTESLYSEVIMKAAALSGVSPYYLASKIRTEIGLTPSGSVTGTYGNYPGIYNFYNIGANDGQDPISNGLNWASLGNSYGKPWTSPEASIVNGAVWIGELYISKGQNTMYFERFNVNPASAYELYTHQYMTSIYGASGQALSIYQGYLSAGNLDEPKVFYIPVYSGILDPSSEVTIDTGSEVKGTPKTDSLNVRIGPGIKYALARFTIQKGEEFTVLSGRRTDSTDRMDFIKYPYWYKITNKSGKSGYVCADYVMIKPSVTLKAGESLNLNIQTTYGDKPYIETLNHNVVSIDSGYRITALKGGTAEIRAFTSGGSLAVVAVSVPGSGIFSDIVGHWAEEPINNVYQMGLFKGTSETKFEPDITMTRAMYVTVLGRLCSSSGREIAADMANISFLDVDETSWYAEYVAWAHENGMLDFIDGQFFSPSSDIKRGEMVLIMFNYAKYLGYDTSRIDYSKITGFRDAESLDAKTKKAAAWAYNNGIIKGISQDMLALESTATRAQVAQIMVNCANALK